MRVATAVVSNGFDQRNLTALSVVAMQSVVVHHKVHVGLTGMMDDEISARIAVIGDTINSLQVLERKNVGDAVRIEPHITIALNAGFLAGLDGSAVGLQSHGFFDVPDLLNWGFVDPGNPDLGRGQKSCKKPVIGGVARQRLIDSSPQDIFEHVTAQVNEMAGTPWGCGPDCSIFPQTGGDHLRAVTEALTENTPA